MKEKDKKSNPHEAVAQQPQLQIKTLFEWIAPGRPFKKRSKRFFVNILLIVLLLEIIIFFFHEYMLMLAILAFLFVTYALNTVPPKNFRYKITTGGITIEDHFFLWQELYDFYFKQRFDSIEILHIRTKAFLPGELTMTINETDKEKIKNILSHFIPYREIIAPTFTDKAAKWLNKNFPLEERKSSKISSKVAS